MCHKTVLRSRDCSVVHKPGSDNSSLYRGSENKAHLASKINPDAGRCEVYALGNTEDLESGKGSNQLSPMPPFGNILVKDKVSQSTR